MKNIILIISLLCYSTFTFSQTSNLHHFRFEIENKSKLDTITQFISIEAISNNMVTAYANNVEFDRFLTWDIPYQNVAVAKGTNILKMATKVTQMSDWDKYPTYEVYTEMMHKFAVDYPSICQLQEFGTLPSGRKLLALKISDNVTSDNEPEPELFYSSTMHGDEAEGFVIMLHLAQYILSNYNKVGFSNITRLVNNAELFINPLANPDGTYKAGNNNVSSATRNNANGIDLNRNYPNPKHGKHPDKNEWQPETIAFMNYANDNHFVLSANFHSGEEVINYPWDSYSKLSVDDSWWKLLSRNYATAVHNVSPSEYLTYKNNGTTNGYNWYIAYGTRQDYMNYYKNCRELTVELSKEKMVASSTLPNYCNYHRDALINYLLEGLNGIQGTVKNTRGEPLSATIEIIGHDDSISVVTTDIRAGDYARLIVGGTYDLRVSSKNYQTKIISGIQITNSKATRLDIVLDSINKSINSPVIKLSDKVLTFMLKQDEQYVKNVVISNVGKGALEYRLSTVAPWINIISQDNGNLLANETDTIQLQCNSTVLDTGNYKSYLKINTNISDTLVNLSLIVGVDNEEQKDNLTVYPNPFVNEFRIVCPCHKGEQISMIIYSSQGKKIYSRSQIATTNGSSTFYVNNASLPSGLYIVNIIRQNKTYSKKIICN